MPGVPRSGFTAGHISARYSNIEELWDGHLDGLIVTGREPKAANLADEPYWDSFTRMFHGPGIIAMPRFFRAWRLMQRFCIWMASGECQGMKRYWVFSSARGRRITG